VNAATQSIAPQNTSSAINFIQQKTSCSQTSTGDSVSNWVSADMPSGEDASPPKFKRLRPNSRSTQNANNLDNSSISSQKSSYNDDDLDAIDTADDFNQLDENNEPDDEQSVDSEDIDCPLCEHRHVATLFEIKNRFNKNRS
jgi:hypothetical protein